MDDQCFVNALLGIQNTLLNKRKSKLIIALENQNNNLGNEKK